MNKKNILRPRNKLAKVDYLGYEVRYLFLSGLARSFQDFTLALSFQVLLRPIENDCHAKRKSQRLSDFRLRKTFMKRS